MSIHYSHCSPSLQKLVNKFYKRFKTNVSCNLNDSVFCALDSAGEVIGAVIIRTIDTRSEYLLRSLYISPEHRGNKIASNLCKFALKLHYGACFTLCEDHLVNFYQGLGFNLSNEIIDSKSINKQIKKGLSLLLRPSLI